MTLFWSVSAGLIAAALLVALRPLLWPRRAPRPTAPQANVAVYRDQLRELDADLAAGKIAEADHARARSEIETRVLEDAGGAAASAAAPAGRRAALAAAIVLPLVAAGGYVAVGSPGVIRLADEHAATTQQVERMVTRLAARMRENPEDVDGWKLLGRSYGVLGRFEESAAAYARAAQRAPRDPQLLADFADALAMARGQTMQGEPEQLVLRALEIDPANLKALALAGTAAFERKDYRAAATLWKRMLPLVPAASEDAQAIEGNVQEALALAGEKPAPAKPAAAAGRALKGTVSLAAALKDQAGPDDLVFIFARAVAGPPMPLAVLRKRVRDLPVSFALDDSMAMAPGANLSAFPKVVISARVSKSGTAKPQAGDLQGASGPVANDASGVRVLIDSVVK
jgi:cytochrome c-type biogenesis protein CcmH